MNARTCDKRLVAAMTVALWAPFACSDSDTEQANDEPVDIEVEAADAGDDAAADAAFADATLRDVGWDPPRREPETLIECQAQTDLHPTEKPWRGSAPEDATLELLWSETPPFEDDSAFVMFDDLSVPTLRTEQLTIGDDEALVHVTAMSTDEGEQKFSYIQSFLDQKWAYGGGSGSASSSERVNTHLPSPAVRDLLGSATILGSYNTFKGEFSASINWSRDHGFLSLGTGPYPWPEDFEVGRFLLLSSGIAALDWGDKWLIGLNPEHFARDTVDVTTELWWTTTDRMWGEGADAPEIVTLAGPTPDAAVVLLENGDDDRKWVAVDRCGEAWDLGQSPQLGREILWGGENYMVSLEDPDHPVGSRIARLDRGEIVDRSAFGCDRFIERQPDSWACLSARPDGPVVLTFDRSFQVTDETPLPVPDGFDDWEHAQLELAGQGGVVVIRGTGRDTEDSLRHLVALVDGENNMAIALETRGGDVVREPRQCGNPGAERRVRILDPRQPLRGADAPRWTCKYATSAGALRWQRESRIR